MHEHFKWQSRSFIIEIKPRCKLACVFVDCPIEINAEKGNKLIENELAELVKVGNQSLIIIANWMDGKFLLHIKLI